MSRPSGSTVIGVLAAAAIVAGGCTVILGIDSPGAEFGDEPDANIAGQVDATIADAPVDAPIGPPIDAPIGPLVDAGPMPDAAGNPVTTLAMGQPNPRGLALDLNNVYWSNMDGTVMRVLKHDNSPTMLAAGPSAAEGPIYVANGFVYWTTREPASPFRMYRTSIAGGGAFTNILAGMDAATGFTIDATGLYTTIGSIAKRADPDGTNQTTIGTVPNPVYWFTKAGNRLYWTKYGNVDGEVKSMDIGTGGVTTIATGQTQPEQIVSDGTRVYWSCVGMDDPVGGGVLMHTGSVQSSLPDGTDLQYYVTGDTRPRAIAVDPSFVYWYSIDQHALMRAPKSGAGPVEIVAVPSGEPNSIAVDSTTLYWVTGSSVEEAAKTP
jgi:hypothetical protein